MNRTRDTNQEDDALAQTPLQSVTQTSRRISNIIVSGNKFSSSNAILNLVPYKIGEIFDQRKTRSLIHNLYYGLKKFRTIKVFGEPINDHFIALHILVEEKTPLAEIKTSGNYHVTDKEIAKKINLDPLLLALQIKINRPVHHAMIGNCQRRHLQLFGFGDELVNLA